MNQFITLLKRPLIVCWAALAVCLGLVTTALAYTDQQAQQGEDIYANYCSTCHGDRGQGLTDEFRSTWPVQDQNCWKSKCHADNHPVTGFTLPKTVPAIVGPGTLQDIPTALVLRNFVSKNMPYQQPGMLSQDEYWAVTAFLLRQRGIPADGKPLNETTAANIRINSNAPAVTTGVPFSPPTMPPSKANLDNRLRWISIGLVVVVAALVIVLGYRVLRRRARPGR